MFVQAGVGVADYLPMLNKSRWVTTSRGFEGNISNQYDAYDSTVVNDTAYVRLLSKVINIDGIDSDPSINGEGYPFLLREDAETQKVYQRFPGSGESLLYDFSLRPGDVMPYEQKSLTLTTLDSVTINDRPHRRYTFDGEDGLKTIWIEGIGNIANPFVANALAGENQYILCFYQQNNLVYAPTTPYTVNCGQVTHTGEELTLLPDNAVIFPNPSADVFTLRFDISSPQSVGISVYDLRGRKLFTHRRFAQPGSNDFTINLETCAAGTYLCAVEVKGYAPLMRKIVKLDTGR